MRRIRNNRIATIGTITLLLGGAWLGGGVQAAAATQSVARQWDEQLLAAIRLDIPRPPVHARNLYALSVAMYDAWAAYDSTAGQVAHHERATAGNIEAAQAESISFAAYRVLKSRFTVGPGNSVAITQANLDAKMDALGYDKSNTSTAGDTPAELGNRVAADVIAQGMADGSNQANNYATNNGYQPQNDSMVLAFPGTTMAQPNHWQPLAFDYLVLQNGVVIGAAVQTFICPHWEGVKPFALGKLDYNGITYLDPGPPPRLGGVGDAQFKANIVDFVTRSSQLDPADPTTLDIGPAAHGNNTLGNNDGHGYSINPVTGQPYAANVVKRADYARVLAEFWADGPNSETPPGHWNVIANAVSDHPLTVKRIGGTGPIVNDLEWDVKLYMALNGAEQDAAIGCWGCKNIYDSVRPISMARYLGGLGQCSDPLGAAYDPNGLPVVPNLIELITAESSAPGQRHEALHDYIGEMALYAWNGQPAHPATEVGGVGWIRAKIWHPYQKSTFVTPAFAAYTSGHSTYSRAGAEVLTAFTGSSYFPGGMGQFTAAQNSFLTFEMGPSQTVSLQWARYYDAADEAGISRLWGGIHVTDDDRQGRIMGSTIGVKAYNQAIKYFQGRACTADIAGTGSVVDVTDLLLVINRWGACLPGVPCFGDIAVDGNVNVSDLLAIINHWGACP